MTILDIMSMVARRNFGLGMKVEELVSELYHELRAEGCDVCIINDRYLECDGQNYQFIKSRANGCWKVKQF